MTYSFRFFLYAVPFYYFFISRATLTSRRVSWILIYILPQFLYIGFNSDLLNDIYKYLLSVVVVYLIYECGYIYNDCVRVANEKKPTLRLNEKERLYIKQRIISIFLSRVVTLFFVSSLLAPFLKLLFWDFLLLNIILMFSIILYNVLYGLKVLIIHFILVTLRYSIPLFFIDVSFFNVVICFVITFSLPNTLERLAEKKFNIPYLVGILDGFRIHSFRVFYYLGLLGFLFIFFEMEFVPIAIYFLSIRLLFLFYYSRVEYDV